MNVWMNACMNLLERNRSGLTKIGFLFSFFLSPWHVNQMLLPPLILLSHILECSQSDLRALWKPGKRETTFSFSNLFHLKTWSPLALKQNHFHTLRARRFVILHTARFYQHSRRKLPNNPEVFRRALPLYQRLVIHIFLPYLTIYSWE